MFALAVIAQIASSVAAEVPGSGNPLYTLGPAGVVLGWFMWRYEVRNELLRSEIKQLGHRFRGLEMALLLEASSRPDCPVLVKEYADREVAKAKVI